MIFDNYASVNEFCREKGFPGCQIGYLLNLKGNLYHKGTGKYRLIVQRLSKLFAMLPEDLFPDRLYGIEKTKGGVEIALSQLADGGNTVMIGEEKSSHNGKTAEMRGVIEEVFSDMRSRNVEIVKMRYGFRGDPMTYNEIGEYFGITRERVRQIEHKMLRMLRHPTRAKRLREALGN